MVTPAEGVFEPKTFLARVGEGKAVLNFVKNQKVFVQGDVADKVFYIQDERFDGRLELFNLALRMGPSVARIGNEVADCASSFSCHPKSSRVTLITCCKIRC